MTREVKRSAPCTICHETKEARHFGMYVFGSEGIWLCHDCEMTVYKFIEQKTHERMRERFQERRETIRRDE